MRSGKLVKDIGFKTEVTLDDIVKVLKLWRSETSFKARYYCNSAMFECLERMHIV